VTKTLYAYRPKSNPSFMIVRDTQDAVDDILKGWLNFVHILWDDRLKYFEEIEAELTYEDEGF